MAYVAVAKALYDYTAQDPEDELSFAEDQILYIVEKEDDDWWKAKLKEEDGEGAVGLIPCTYVEEIPPINQTRALYAYESTSPEELSMEEDAVLYVFAVEDDWILVKIDGGSDVLGFVPRTYCEEMDEANGIAVADADDGAADVEAQRALEEEQEQARQLAAHQRELRAKDTVETWSLAELDGSKKKKGTLGVGNGAIFFASEADKSPVKQFPITSLAHVEPESAKVLSLIMTSGSPLRLHTGDAQTSKAIVAKLEQSKEAAGEALQLTNDVDDAGAGTSEDEAVLPPPTHKSVSFAGVPPASPVSPLSPTAGAGAESCVAAYDFEAQGDDELTIAEGEQLTVLERENDEWWLVRNAHGKEGVVPAAYVEMADGAEAAAPAAARSHSDVEADAAAAAAALEATRRQEQAQKEAQRRAIEQAAREREEQEAADREIARQVEAEEREKRERGMRQAEEDARRKREMEAAKRREAARRMEPPKISSRPTAQDIAAAARGLPSGREKSTPRRPSEGNRPKPNPARTRIWSDRTGQFKVEAEFLGLNGNKLRLHKMNGVIIEVPMDKMSPEDTQMIKRYMARQRSRHEADDDDVPLGKVRGPSQQMSYESRSRAEGSSRSSREPQRDQGRQQQRRQTFDWFAFFLEAGCDIDDCTRYATNFDRDRIDESILADLDSTTMRSLGLREGDVIRVRKLINVKYAKKSPEQQSQISQDEEYARKLQEHENSGSKGPAPVPPPGLFTNPDGKLANNTRRGRPDRKGSAPALNAVDSAALSAASEQLSKVSLEPMEPRRVATPPVAVSPPSEEEKKEPLPKHLLGGFDDDAWTLKPARKASTSTGVASPTTSVASPISSQKTGTDALLAQIQQMRPANADPPKGGDFNVLAGLPTPQQAAQNRANSAPAMPPPQSYGLGTQNTSSPMAQIPQQQVPAMPDPNAPRGPLAPVRQNEGLLNPLRPATTGMFVPTHHSGQQQQFGMMSQPTGMMGQQHGMMSQPTGMMSQQTGMGYQQQPAMQPAYTGYGGYQQPQQNSTFNAIANLPPPQVPQQTGSGDKFAPTNIFAAMKRTDFGKPEEQNPQSSNKYDALRPLTTGYNGAPGMMPQATGMPMHMQQTGMPMGGGMGMMPNMTGYNPQMGMGQQMGYMGQNQYGQY